MTSSDSLPQPSELKVLRENAKIELSDLARKTNLSVAQLSQLESGGDHLFYSEDIKRQSIKRVLKVIASVSQDCDSAGSAPSKLTLPSSSSDHASAITAPIPAGADEIPSELATQAPPIQAQIKPNYTRPSAHNKSVIDGIVKLSSKSRHPSYQVQHSFHTHKGLSPMAWGAIGIGCASWLLYWSPWDKPSTELISSASPTQISTNTGAQIAIAPPTEKTVTNESSNTLLSNVLGVISSLTSKAASSPNAAPVLPAGSTPTDTQLLAAASSLGGSSTPLATALPNNSGISLNTNTPTNTTPIPTSNLSSASTTPTTITKNPPLASPSSSPASAVATTANTEATSTNADHSGTKPQAIGGADACQLLSAKATTLSPSNPTKASNYVYLTGAIDTQVCVVDATGKKTPLQVVKNQGVSVYGKAPWQLAGADLAKLQIYFQGWRVNLSDTSAQKLQLVEQGSNP